jgi:hypothetical protein
MVVYVYFADYTEYLRLKKGIGESTSIQGGYQAPTESTKSEVEKDHQGFGSGKTGAEITANEAKKMSENIAKQVLHQLLSRETTGEEEESRTQEFDVPIAPSTSSAVKLAVFSPQAENSDIFIKQLPNKFQKKAQKLVSELAEFPGDISWSKDGQLYIDQESIPGTNIVELLLATFNATKNPTGIETWLNILKRLNMDDYVSKKRQFSSRLPKKPTTSIELIDDDNDDWSYIGE